MRIAYISYEHPSGIPGGGIGTYIDTIASVMSERQHDVEVFSASADCKYDYRLARGYKLHLIPAISQDDFRDQVTAVFDHIQQLRPFDLIEGAEYGADSLLIKRKYPDIPLVIKLHTPRFLVDRLNLVNPSFFAKFRFLIGGLIRGKLPEAYWKKRPAYDPEHELFWLADEVYSPSESIAAIVKAEWGDRDINIVANPSPAITETLSNPATDHPVTVLFIGRLEQRKGIYDLGNAIPIVLKKHPTIRFYFAGKDQPSMTPGVSTEVYLKERLKPFRHNLYFCGLLTPEALKGTIDEADICIFPSLWENFPNVCLETMSSCKAVIASNNGGMSEMIDHLKNGYLIPPHSPDKIAQAIIELAENNELRHRLSAAARPHVCKNFGPNVIGEKTELFYQYTLSSKN